MAILLDQDLGSTDNNPAGATVTLTTAATAAANTRIVVYISFFTDAAYVVTSVSDGSSYTLDKRTTNANDVFEIWSRGAASSLASGSTITLNFTSSNSPDHVGGILVSAASFTGIPSSGAVVTTASSTTTGTGWSSGAATNTGFANALYTGGSGNEDITNPTTSTATSGTEIHDRYRVADQQGMATGYKIVSTVASDSVTGNFSNANSTANTGALVIYQATVDAGGVRTFNPIPFMPGNL